MFFLWLPAGILLFVVAFYFSSTQPVFSQLQFYLWLSVILTAAFLFNFWEKLKSRLTIYAGILPVLLLFAPSLYINPKFERNSNYQKSELIKVRSVIGNGIAATTLNKIAIEIVRRYRESPAKDFSAVWSKIKNDPASVFNSVLRDISADSSILIYDPVSTSKLLAVVVVDKFGKGKNPFYLNINGLKGAIQARAIITESEVRYEYEN